MKFPATTNRERLFHNYWDLVAHGGGKKYLTKTSRPGFVSTVKPDLPQELMSYRLFIIRVKRELKRVYRNGCRYNERLNAETGDWVPRVNI